MSYDIIKPSRAYLRGQLSYSEPNLERVIETYLDWVAQNHYLIFRRENIHTWEKSWKAVKASKRCNDVYVHRTKKRLQKFYSMSDVIFFDVKDRSGRHHTKVLFVSFTYLRELSIREAWDQTGIRARPLLTR
jgi:hypothetical protein